MNNLLEFIANYNTKVTWDHFIANGYTSGNVGIIDFDGSIARYRNVRILVSFLQKAHQVCLKLSR
jgi:hypothetical protein